MPDIHSEERKKDHIDLAFRSQLTEDKVDPRFYYEPMLTGHPKESVIPVTSWGAYDLKIPVWVSSMTGGTQRAMTINENLARACQQFGMGMGLGSCRPLLDSDDRLHEFAVKKLMPDVPLYANIGVAQLAELMGNGHVSKISELVKKLDADGLIIHINPLQEWMQPEGDRYFVSPIDAIKSVLDECPELSIIVKEVGQGMGPRSLKALYDLPILAVDFGAAGGTNFSLLELLRSTEEKQIHMPLASVGHTATEMVDMAADILATMDTACVHTIVSGGISSYLDGYYCIQKMGKHAIYGQASAFLRHAMGDYHVLEHYVAEQVKGLEMAYQFLTVKG